MGVVGDTIGEGWLSRLVVAWFSVVGGWWEFGVSLVVGSGECWLG